MIGYDDIKDVLKKESLKDLEFCYEKRQKENLEIDEYYSNSVLNELDFLEDYVESGLSYEQKILSYIILAQSTNPKIREIILRIFKLYEYKFNSELLRTMQFADSFFSKELDSKTFKLFCKSAFNFESVDFKNNGLLVRLNGISIPMEIAVDALGLNGSIEPNNRRHYCHDITSSFLLSMPNLYGAYYYVPIIFGGNIEHSVLINPDDDMVYDVANNIAIPLSIFDAFYKYPTFVIKGSEFSELNKRIYDEYGGFLTTAHLEEVRRRKK